MKEYFNAYHVHESRLKRLNPRPDLKVFRAVYHLVYKKYIRKKHLEIEIHDVEVSYKLKYSQISCIKRFKLISNTECKVKM